MAGWLAAGVTKERGSGSANPEKQHDGVNPVGINGDHAILTHHRPYEQPGRLQLPRRIRLRRQKRANANTEILLHISLFLVSILVQRPVHSLLQPRQHANQRPTKESAGAA